MSCDSQRPSVATRRTKVITVIMKSYDNDNDNDNDNDSDNDNDNDNYY